MGEACRNCRFSRSKIGRDSPYLFCRRYPPTQLAEGESFFPLVERDEWCGEWMAMRPGAGLPAEIKPSPKRPGGARAVLLSESKRRIEAKP